MSTHGPDLKRTRLFDPHPIQDPDLTSSDDDQRISEHAVASLSALPDFPSPSASSSSSSPFPFTPPSSPAQKRLIPPPSFARLRQPPLSVHQSAPQVPQAPRKFTLSRLGGGISSQVMPYVTTTPRQRRLKRNDFFTFNFLQSSSSSSSGPTLFPIIPVEGTPHYKLPFRYRASSRLIFAVPNDKIILLQFKDNRNFSAKNYYRMIECSCEQYELAKTIFGDGCVQIYNNPKDDLYFVNELIPYSLETILQQLFSHIPSSLTSLDQLANSEDRHVQNLRSILGQIKSFYSDALRHLDSIIPLDDEEADVDTLKRKRETEVKFFDPDFNIGNFRAIESNGSYQLKLTDFREKVDSSDPSDPLSNLSKDLNILRSYLSQLITSELFDQFFGEIKSQIRDFQGQSRFQSTGF